MSKVAAAPQTTHIVHVHIMREYKSYELTLDCTVGMTARTHTHTHAQAQEHIQTHRHTRILIGTHACTFGPYAQACCTFTTCGRRPWKRWPSSRCCCPSRKACTAFPACSFCWQAYRCNVRAWRFALCVWSLSAEMACLCICMCPCLCVCVYAFARACAYVHVCVLVHVYVYLRMPLYVSACANIVSSCGSASATGAAALGALVAQRVWLVGHVLACACRACACMTLHLMLQEVLAW